MPKLTKNKSLKPNVFNKDCPSREILNKISNKWSLLVIDALKNGRSRNGELMRHVEGISQKMLTQTLRELEFMKIVDRIDMQTIPPHVEYRLTALGRSLRVKVDGLDRWVEKHMLKIINK